MRDYYLRCIESDVPLLLRLGTALGVLQEVQDEEGNTKITGTTGSSFDVIGPIYSPAVATGVVDANGFPVFIPGDPKKNANGNVYWHANLRTELDLLSVAQDIAKVNPEIALYLPDISRFFITDSVTELAAAPANPVRVFL